MKALVSTRAPRTSQPGDSVDRQVGASHLFLERAQGLRLHWLDVWYEIKDSPRRRRKSSGARMDKSGGGAVPGLGDSAYSVVNLTTTDKQQTREGVVIARASNALVVVTYNGSNFETKKAPSTTDQQGGHQGADVVATLENGQKGEPVLQPPR